VNLMLLKLVDSPVGLLSHTCTFWLHQMHEMQTIVTDDCGVCPSVCLS